MPRKDPITNDDGENVPEEEQQQSPQVQVITEQELVLWKLDTIIARLEELLNK